jgi:hypothetical protein
MRLQKQGGKKRKAAEKRKRSKRWRLALSAAPQERKAELKAQRAAGLST